MARITRQEDIAVVRMGEPRFSGPVWRDDLIQGGEPQDIRLYRVSFAPGAVTAWHSHPSWQILHVISGLGRLQSRGGEMEVLRPGDTAWIPPGEEHWHGAAPDQHFVHLALHEAPAPSQDAETLWLEPVTP